MRTDLWWTWAAVIVTVDLVLMARQGIFYENKIRYPSPSAGTSKSGSKGYGVTVSPHMYEIGCVIRMSVAPPRLTSGQK